MKITRRQLRKLIMEMPMGGYFGSMHGGAGNDFISAVEVEAMKYPDHSIYIDDASNNPSEFLISSSPRDDAQGPQSHYLTSIHVKVYEIDGMIYVDGQEFSSYAEAAAQILTDLEDERQKSMMGEGLLKEADMTDMVTLLAQAAITVLTVGTPAAILYAHTLLDKRMRKAYTRRDLEKIRQSSNPEETAKEILQQKGLIRGEYGIPEADLDDPDAARRRRNYFKTDDPFANK